jgi:hypothetical protein
MSRPAKRPAQQTLGIPGGEDHGAQRSGSRPGNEVFALLGRTGTRHRPAAFPGTAPSTAGVFGFAQAATVSPPTWPVLASAALVATAVFPPRSAVKAIQSERPCLFASGEASVSQHLRRPPQIRPQPTHPVRQNAAWHPQVNGGVAVTPAVYNPAVQQRAVIWGQISARRLHPTRLHHDRHGSRQ